MAKKTKAKSAPRSRPATHADAELLLHLYDQRRDEKLRKARNFVLFEFIPTADEEFAALAFNFGSEQQLHFRMVFSYWEQTAALSNRGVIHGELFDDFSGELFFLYAKYGSFFHLMRERLNPDFGKHIEEAAMATPGRRARVERAQKMIASRRAQPKAAGR
ncbi:MAG: hypothetical protein M3P27_10310 [Acidobacteriota bacterium]|nr:hypothetical protein [Acidobacteriota bacterium]